MGSRNNEDCLEVVSAYHRVSIPFGEIMYIRVEGRKSVLMLADGRQISTNTSIRSMFSRMPKDVFSMINKGVMISMRHLASVEGLDYRMNDGAVLRGRVKTSNESRWMMRMQVIGNQSRSMEILREIVSGSPVMMAVIRRGDRDEILYATDAWVQNTGIGIGDVTEQFEHMSGYMLSSMSTLEERLEQDGGVCTVRSADLTFCLFRLKVQEYCCIARKNTEEDVL